MAQAILLRGGIGGVTSDDVTTAFDADKLGVKSNDKIYSYFISNDGSTTYNSYIFT